MNTREMTRERISAFVDGECADSQLNIALAALRKVEGKADWEIYHQIGDVLRSNDMAMNLSEQFAIRMAARLEAEPVFVPRPSISQTEAGRSGKKNYSFLSRMAAAVAVAAVAFITTPHLVVAIKGEYIIPSGVAVVSSDGRTTPVKAADFVVSKLGQETVMTASVPEGVVLRDPRIDDYLWAHQRFSPSVYSSTAQYARSATFAADFNK
jgi:sigma-E factor negative regulatory protein RseA